MKGLRVEAVERDDSGESAIRGTVSGHRVEVRFVETSGEFRLVSGEGDAELSRSEVRDLAPALEAFRDHIPWADSAAGFVLEAVSLAVFPSTLRDFQVRSLSDLGGKILLAGWTANEEVDLVLDVASRTLSIIVTSSVRKAPRRPLTSDEAHELCQALGAPVAARLGLQRRLLRLVLDAARRIVQH